MKYFLGLMFVTLSFFVVNAYGVLNVLADTSSSDDTIDGEFKSSGYNNPVEVTNFTFTKANTDTAINDGGSLTPQQEYYFKIDLIEYDSFEDIESVEVVFYTTSTAMTLDPSTTTDGSIAVFEWNRNVGFTTAGAMGLSVTDSGVRTISNTHAGMSWEVTNSTVPAFTADNSATEVAFEVSFKISKVAEQGTNNWQFGYVIKDGLLNLSNPAIISNVAIQEGSNPDGGSFGYSMDWYGEIDVPAGGISWTAITPGMDFDDANSLQTTGAIRYIANGDYFEKVAVTEVWNVTNAVLDNVTNTNITSSSMISSANPPQTFALKIVSGTGLSGNFSPVGSGVEFTPDYSDSELYTPNIDISSETFFADEAGRQKIYQFKVMTSEDLQNATYTGEFKFTISNSAG